MNKFIAGEIRTSQLLRVYGPGALIDLPSLSVITMGINNWSKEECDLIQEPRLLTKIQSILGPKIRSFRAPPFATQDVFRGQWSQKDILGVPVRPFPVWLRCTKCGLLGRCHSNSFRLVTPRQSQFSYFVHKKCRGSQNDQRAQDAEAVPTRFLMACRAGHLDDFPWDWFVHRGDSDCIPILRFFESGASLQTENLWVKCDSCGKSRSMAQAFGEISRAHLPACRGRHPHIEKYEEGCTEEPRTILLGATNSWFPIMLSALAIPEIDNQLGNLIKNGWDFFEEIYSVEQVELVVKTLEKADSLPGIEKFNHDEIFSAIKTRRTKGDEFTTPDLKNPEWSVLTDQNPSVNHKYYKTKEVIIPSNFTQIIIRVLLLERLREVSALLGFTRVEPPNEETELEPAPRATLGDSNWLPAMEIYGEGIFIQFDSNILEKWNNKESVKLIDQRLQKGYQEWRTRRKLNPKEGYQGVRYTMLHTLAHMLIRELALECGYNAASIRERIYANTTDGQNQAGFLIYTAAADSDGTLGGLVELGRPENLDRLLYQALTRARICSSDPLCAEHDPASDQSLHGAACHACSFVSETSCEYGNRFLDRALVVPTLEYPEAAFFQNL